MMKTLFTIIASSVSTLGIGYVIGKFDEIQKVNIRQKSHLDTYRTDQRILKKTLRNALDALHDHDPAAAHRIHRGLVNDIKFRDIIKDF